MKVHLAVPASAILLSCASGGSPTTSRDPAGMVGATYDFVATTPRQVIRGSIRIEADTMYLDAERDCLSNIRSEPIGRGNKAGVFRYGCAGATLEFDSRNPIRASRWFATVAVQRLREVCAQREVRNGREVCVRTEIERYEVPESRSGTIQVTRRP